MEKSRGDFLLFYFYHNTLSGDSAPICLQLLMLNSRNHVLRQNRPVRLFALVGIVIPGDPHKTRGVNVVDQAVLEQ